jgi:predicted dehydrogenase
MQKLRTAVIGIGYLGKFHAEKLAKLPDSELVAVCDTDQNLARELAQQYNIQTFADYRELIGLVDAVCIVVPTLLHFEVAKFFLEHKVHVLLEKPITNTLAEADALIDIANKAQCVLQIGHLERFNSTVVALQEILNKPRFIESHRLAPFNPRGTDVNVILDLMIHDIDIIQCIAKSPIKSIDASGVKVLSPHIDIVNARIRFVNGCVANVTASRVSVKSERKMRIFQDDAYISTDFQHKKLSIYRKSANPEQIVHEEKSFGQSDALLAEIAAFLSAVKNGTKPLVSAEDGRNALATAIAITELVEQELQTIQGVA